MTRSTRCSPGLHTTPEPRTRSEMIQSRPLVLAAALLLAPAAPAAANAQQPTDPAADTLPGAASPAAQAPSAGDAPPATLDTFALPGIVVTATRVPLSRAALPTPVTVWTGAELRARGVGTVAEALARSPGATVARAGSPGAQTSLFLRGGESDYVKVLIDGVPVNDPGGAFDFADLTTDQVERIEVVRGPVSVLYGSDAVAGVVQVITRRSAGAPTLTARVLGGRGQERGPAGSESADPVDPAPGSYGVLDIGATATGSAGAVAYTVGGSRSWSQGLYPFNNDRGHTTATTRLAWAPAPDSRLSVSTRYTDSRSHFPTDGTGALVDENARLDRRLWSTAVVAGFPLHHRLDARIRAGLATRDQQTVDAPDGPADTLGTFASELAWDLVRRSVDARVDWTPPRRLLPGSVLSVGVAWEQAEATSSYTSRSAFGPYAADAEYRRTTRGSYLQLLAEPTPGVHLTAGGRIDDSDSYGASGTYRLGMAIEPIHATRLRMALGRGFKEPSFDQVFGSGFGDRGNPALEPERSRSWEAGVEQRLGSVTLAATWFDQRFERLVQYTVAPPSADDPNYFNVGAATARGLEVEAAAGMGRLAMDASYTYLQTEVVDPGLATDAGFVEGEELLRRPRSAATLAGRYRLERGSVGLTVNAVGPRKDLDFAAGFPAPRISLPGYATLDMTAEHDVPGSGVTVLLQVDNALDARYQSVAGFPGLGRVVRLGARVRVH